MPKDPALTLLEHPWIMGCSDEARKKILSNEDFYKQALEYRKMIQMNKPPKGQLFMNIGNEILDKGFYELSRQAYNLCYRDNDTAAVLNNIGYAYTCEKNYEKSVEYYKAALAVKSTYERAINNVASDLIRHAIVCFDRDTPESMDQCEKLLHESLSYKPNHDWAYLNMGNLWERRGFTKKAIYWFELAIEVNPTYSAPRSNIAHAYFKVGDFGNSFENFEWRSKTDDNPGKKARFTDRLYWDGKEDLAGKSILLHWEQGFGDMIQCVRYLFWFRQKYPTANIVLETMEALDPLFKQLADPAGFVGDVDPECIMPCVNETLINKREDYKDRLFDFVYPIYSLPRLYFLEKQSIPMFSAYLHRPPAKQSWIELRDSLRAKKKKIVGLNWAGRPAHGNDRFRSTHLSFLRGLVDNPELADCQFVSFQMGEQRSQIKELGLEDKIVDVVDLIENFCDATMIIHDIDYLITVDSAYLHLAGAIGTKAIALIAKRSDYRWMLERKDSILYPSVRVVRQKANLIWDDQERQEMVDIIRGRDALLLTGK